MLLGSLLVAAVLLEVAARIVDGRLVGGLRSFGTPEVIPIENWTSAMWQPGSGAKDTWRLSPSPLPRAPPSAEDVRKFKEFGGTRIEVQLGVDITPYELFKVWNRQYARDPCHHGLLKHLVRWPLQLFEPVSSSDRPRYRYPPNATLPTGLVTNEIGWRGKPLRPRQARTVRIVFVGASTTVEGHQMAWSAPELLEKWLNTWAADQQLDVDFQVLNAGREGATSPEITQIVKDEVVPMQPDLVVFYEGANQFDLASLVRNSKELKALPRPSFEATAGTLGTLARSSSLAAHVLVALRQTGWGLGDVPEAVKPDYELHWPENLDEQDPDITRLDLPANIGRMLHDLDDMRATLSGIGAEFAVSSFVWLVFDGLKVDPVQGRWIWRTNNQLYWPWRYRDIRRLVDFQNRAYAKFARTRGLPFLDVAGRMPLDPSLFADGLHMTASGVRVKAWAFYQELVPLLAARLKSKGWPKTHDREQWPRFAVERQSITCP